VWIDDFIATPSVALRAVCDIARRDLLLSSVLLFMYFKEEDLK
jgi:hypothetical protein